ncbi:MAG: hypothetical protein O2973_09660 [Gemmatimonadetes bacterium]|nr:hypothetical protein [Gemmatimonadota bacterium]
MNTPVPTRKPRDDEIDVFGLTHQGKVRKNNQDQFLLASIHKRVNVVLTSLPEAHRHPLADERLAFIAMVADGVGGLQGGEEASATAIDAMMEYVSHSMDCYYRADSGEEQFIDELQTAAFRTPLSNVLSSALGGDTAMPVVTRMQSEWGTVALICSDGLTKHVSDDQITKRLTEMTSSKQVCEQLLQDALDGGGTDNITIIVGRAVPKAA